MNDGCAARHRTVDRTRLHAIARVLHRFLVRALGHADALDTHCVAGRVHHDEHVLEAAVLLADEISDCTALVAELQHRRRTRLDAELVLDAHAMHIVARTERAVGIDHELRHDEQADALHAFGCAGHASQHEMDDVPRHVVLAVGDEDLGAEDLVAAVGLRLGSGANQREVGTGLRLGQVHRAGPLARNHLRQVSRLLLRAARGQQRLDRAVGQ